MNAIYGRQLIGVLCGFVVVICVVVLFSHEYYTPDELAPIFLATIPPLAILISAFREYWKRSALDWSMTQTGTVGIVERKYTWRTACGADAQAIALKRSVVPALILLGVVATWAYRSDWSYKSEISKETLALNDPYVVARDWLSSTDGEHYTEAWVRTAPEFQQHMPRKYFPDMLQDLRARYGASRERTLLGQERPLDNAVRIKFRSRADQQYVYETVSLLRDADGRWLVDRFTISEGNRGPDCLPSCSPGDRH